MGGKMTRGTSTRTTTQKKEAARKPVAALRLMSLLTLVGIVLIACAPEVVRRPAEFTPSADGADATIEVLADLAIAVGPGYSRVIACSRVGQS